ncbi:hypothetical protein NDU88_003140 [Pleurodeles waltl]|uniref:Uncharacterized protein n=1 Tax=Pleurodeles waltl TaxID=8319 RepID=A0AAV7T4E2_PLEWA|nr:hypothetical protein NDU88_003140 [Pleurodeles waltl]
MVVEGLVKLKELAWGWLLPKDTDKLFTSGLIAKERVMLGETAEGRITPEEIAEELITLDKFLEGLVIHEELLEGSEFPNSGLEEEKVSPEDLLTEPIFSADPSGGWLFLWEPSEGTLVPEEQSVEPSSKAEKEEGHLFPKAMGGAINEKKLRRINLAVPERVWDREE